MILAWWKQDRWTPHFPGQDIILTTTLTDPAKAGLALHFETTMETGQAPPPGSQFYTEETG